jgi:hypothetical protein
VRIPGYKLVAKKELRKFSDPDLTAAALLQAGVQSIFTDPLLKSPAQIEKTLKAEQIVFDLSPWLKEASGELEITNDRDKRAEVKKDVVSINICGMLSNSSSVTE